MRANALPESRVVEIWQNHLPGRNDLITEGGETLRIIYPGRINDDRGSDFLDAVITSGRRLIKGDIEVHVKSSSWWGHGHHRNPDYNRVVLHVVFWHDTKIPVNLQNGQKVPTLELQKFINQADQRANSAYLSTNRHIPCRKMTSRWSADATGELLDVAGEARFLTKAADFQAGLTHMEPSQSLYQGIMGALGYAKNKTPMLNLATRLPLQTLHSMTQDKISDQERSTFKAGWKNAVQTVLS